MGGLTIVEPGPLATVQDLGRPGHAALGVSPSGAGDRDSHRLANRLVGNPETAATIEVTLGGLVVTADVDVVLAVTGARCPGTDHNAVVSLPAGRELRLGTPLVGLRSYVAVRGGMAPAPVLGSCATDLLSGLGPEPLSAGDRIEIGESHQDLPDVGQAAVAEPEEGTLLLPLTPGPRRAWFPEATWAQLIGESYTVSAESNRIAVRLEGGALSRSVRDELPSEGLVRGALQVPPSGHPVLFLADHPVTGGYPVIAYVRDADVDRCAQLRPGQQVRFRDPVGPVGPVGPVDPVAPQP